MVLLLVQLWESCQEEEGDAEAAPRSKDASTQTGSSSSSGGKVMVATSAAGKEEDVEAGWGGAFAVFEFFSKVCVPPLRTALLPAISHWEFNPPPATSSIPETVGCTETQDIYQFK